MNERKHLRVLHVLGSMDPGGVETWLLSILKYIDRDSLEFHFCTLGTKAGLYANDVERLGGKVIRCPKSLNLWSFRNSFRKLLREGKYDVLHSHVYFFSGALLRWAKEEGIPIRIAHSHASRDNRPDNPMRRCYRALMRSWINRNATCGLAVSKLAAAELFGEHWEADSRLRVLHCGIDLDAFQEPIDRNAVRKELGLPLDTPVVGHVANFLPAKNHSFVLEIAAQVLKSRPEIHFLLVGDGPLRPRIQERAASMGLSNQMHFVGTRTDVPRLMRGAMDFYLFPSISEGFGITLLEAQAAGLGCLASDAIPREVSCIPGCVEFLPLSAGIEHWAHQTINRLEMLGSERASAPTDVARSRISIRHSARDLTSVYSSAQLPRIPIVLEQHA
ncbi:MAG: glycosyltransferase [Candidatus Acidiferrales bacterium]